MAARALASRAASSDVRAWSHARIADWLCATAPAERAQQQDDELHRDLQHGVEHQAQTALAQRGAADVALHLRLVGAEVREREEQAAEHAGPHRVAPARIE